MKNETGTENETGMEKSVPEHEAVGIMEVRKNLVGVIDAISVYDDEEDKLIAMLMTVQRNRARLYAAVHDIMEKCERSSFSSDDFRILLEGIHHKVAVALSRHSVDG